MDPVSNTCICQGLDQRLNANGECEGCPDYPNMMTDPSDPTQCVCIKENTDGSGNCQSCFDILEGNCNRGDMSSITGKIFDIIACFIKQLIRSLFEI